MATSYTRQSSFSDGDTITAALFNNEYNQLLNAFAYASSGTTGHRHDGTAAEGGNIHTIGDQDFLNKIVADSTNNRWGVFVQVSSSAVEQVRFQDGVIVPVTDNDVDLGTSSVEFKDAYFDGTVTTDALVADTADINGGTVDGATIGASSATTGVFTTIQGSTITATTAFVPDASDGAALGTSALEFSDLFLADGAVINFGDDQDVTLTHVVDTGLLLSSTDQLQFGDSGTYIHQSADGVLDLVSDTEIELTATTIDINGAVAMDGAITGGTNITISGELDAATLDISGNADIDGTTNLDAVDIDGAVQIDATVTVGVDDTGYDVKFFGDTASAYMLWDTSADDLILGGAARVVVPESGLVIGSTAVTSTAAELNILDGVSSTAAELNILDGVTSTATELNYNDTGTSVGTVVASKTVTVDANKDVSSFRNITLTGELDAGSLDVSGDADIDGTLEADAITVNGTTLATFIRDTVGTNMLSSNTESGITVTYDTTNDNIDFAVDAAQTGITSIYATDLILGEDSQTAIDFGTANEIDFKVDNAARLTLTSGALYPVTDNQIDLGTSSLEFKDAFFDGTVTADAFAGPLTGDVTGNVSGTAATVTTAAQSNITSLGTLTTLTVDNIIVNGTNIGHTSDTDAIAIASDGVVTMNQIPVFSAGVNVSGGTIAGTLATAAQGNITSLGTLTTLTVDNVIINGTNIGHTSDTDSIAIASDGVVTFSQVPVFPNDTVETADIQDNAVTLAKMASGTDGNIISYDASGNPVAIATGNDGQVLTSTGAGSPPAFEDAAASSIAADDIAAGDAAVTLTTSSGNITIDAAANDSDIIFKGTDATSDITMLTLDGSEAGAATFNAGIVIADAGTIGSASDTDAIAIGSDGDVTLTQDLELQHDGAILSFGANDEVSLTHVHDTGILLNSTMAIQFNDASQYINAPSNAILDINATDEIELNATLADVNANLDVSGTYTGGGLMTTGGNIVIPDAGNIGSASDTDAIAIGSDGDVTLTQDLELQHDGATLSFGANDEITITHVHDVGLTLTHTATGDNTPMVLQLKSEEDGINANEVISSLEFAAGDSNGGDGAGVAAGIHAIAEDTFSATVNSTKLVFTTGVSETAAASATAKATLSSIGDFQVAGDLVVKDAGLIGSDSDKDAIAIGSDGDVTLTQDLELQHDGAILSFGANDEVSLTHVHDTGLLLNSTMALQFNDASQYINAPSATILDINATDEIELNATLADVNANLDVSGTYQGGGTMTTGGNIVIPDDGNIGSASDTDAISIDSSGRVQFSAAGPYFNTGPVYQATGQYNRGYSNLTASYEAVESKGFTTYFNDDTYVYMRCQDGTAGADCWHMRRNGTTKSAIEENGDFLSATGSYGTISDERLKEHIIDSGSQWDDVKAMRIRKYSFIEDEEDGPTQLGVIAQELEASGMGGLVKTKANTTIDPEDGPDKPMLDEDGNPTDFKVVKMSILYMKAVKALQEAMERIESLESRIEALEL